MALKTGRAEFIVKILENLGEKRGRRERMTFLREMHDSGKGPNILVMGKGVGGALAPLWCMNEEILNRPSKVPHECIISNYLTLVNILYIGQ